MPENEIKNNFETSTDGGKEVLDQWQHTNVKSANPKAKKRKNKKKGPNGILTESTQKPDGGAGGLKAAVVPNGDTPVVKAKVKEDYKLMTKKEREKTISRGSSGFDPRARAGPHSGIDKSSKELHRHVTALEHSRLTLKEHLDRSYKRVSEVFKELRQQMQEREALMVSQLDQTKIKAYEVVDGYGKRCAELKTQTDRLEQLSDQQVTELRSDIKNLSGERKHFEDMSQSTWFSCQFGELLSAINNFGEVNSRRTFPDFKTPSPTITTTSSSTTTTTTTTTTTITTTATIPSNTHSPPHLNTTNANPVLSTHIHAQSDSLTKYEQQALLNKIDNININKSDNNSNNNDNNKNNNNNNNNKNASSNNINKNNSISKNRNNNNNNQAINRNNNNQAINRNNNNQAINRNNKNQAINRNNNNQAINRNKSIDDNDSNNLNNNDNNSSTSSNNNNNNKSSLQNKQQSGKGRGRRDGQRERESQAAIKEGVEGGVGDGGMGVSSELTKDNDQVLNGSVGQIL